MGVGPLCFHIFFLLTDSTKVGTKGHRIGTLGVARSFELGGSCACGPAMELRVWWAMDLVML